MNVLELKLGMVCQTKKGVGVVCWIDAQDRAVYLSDPEHKDQHIAVSFDEIQDEPQLHQNADIYY